MYRETILIPVEYGGSVRDEAVYIDEHIEDYNVEKFTVVLYNSANFDEYLHRVYPLVKQMLNLNDCDDDGMSVLNSLIDHDQFFQNIHLFDLDEINFNELDGSAMPAIAHIMDDDLDKAIKDHDLDVNIQFRGNFTPLTFALFHRPKNISILLNNNAQLYPFKLSNDKIPGISISLTLDSLISISHLENFEDFLKNNKEFIYNVISFSKEKQEIIEFIDRYI